MTIMPSPTDRKKIKKIQKMKKLMKSSSSTKSAVNKKKVTVAPLYNEDIGLEGLPKRKRMTHDLPSSFEVVVDKKEENKREKRMKRFVEHHTTNGFVSKQQQYPLAVDLSSLSSTQSNNGSSSGSSNNEEEDLLLLPLRSSRNGFHNNNDEEDHNNNNDHKYYDCKPLVGTCTSLEKPYMRLTTAPKACNVRPMKVLQKSLAHIKAHYIQNEDFDYANEQLKSIRQDITVQHLRNVFVLNVYETHSRLLLEHGDLNEFNQCQTMIRSLTASSSLSSKPLLRHTKNESKKEEECDNKNTEEEDEDGILHQSEENADEFQAYNLLYDVVQNSWSDLTVRLKHSIQHTTDLWTIVMNNSNSNCGGCNNSSSGSSKNDIQQLRCDHHNHHHAVIHAMNVIKSIIHHDYHGFFKLYTNAPHMSVYLMDFLVRRVRDIAYGRMISAYRPSLSIEIFRENLHFEDLDETRRYLKRKNAIFIKTTESGCCNNVPFWIDCKATVQQEQEQNRGGGGMSSSSSSASSSTRRLTQSQKQQKHNKQQKRRNIKSNGTKNDKKKKKKTKK